MSDQTSFYPELARDIAPARGRLGVLLPGIGAVSTTLAAGVFLVNKGLARPFGSLTQMQHMRLGKRTEPRFVSDPRSRTAGRALGSGLRRLGHLPRRRLRRPRKPPASCAPRCSSRCGPELESIVPWPGVFDPAYVKRLDGTHVKKGADQAAPGRAAARRTSDGFIDAPRLRAPVARLVRLDRGLPAALGAPRRRSRPSSGASRRTTPRDLPSMIYAYAALSTGIPFANGAPNLCVDVPAADELARESGVPIAGKDFKTGQTLMKTIIAPGLKAADAGPAAAGSRPTSSATATARSSTIRAPSEQGGLASLACSTPSSQPEIYPELYGDYSHKVRIDYYPPRGDDKEGWDNIDICRAGSASRCRSRSISSAGTRSSPRPSPSTWSSSSIWRSAPGSQGIQEWLSFYFKSPMSRGRT